MSLMTWLRNLFTPKKSEPSQSVALGRNDLCWCGSGKKYKKCHLGKDAHNQREAKYAAQFAEQQRRKAGIVPTSTAAASGKRKPGLPPENKEQGPVSAGKR